MRNTKRREVFYRQAKGNQSPVHSLIMISFLLFSLLTSCKRTGEQMQPVSTPAAEEFSVNQGIVAFKTHEEFKTFMEKAAQKDITAFEKRFASLPGFANRATSFKSKHAQLQIHGSISENDDDEPWDPNDDPEYEDPLVQDPYLSSILNDKREIEIQGVILRITEKGVYAYYRQNIAEFDALYANAAHFDALIQPYAITHEYYEDDDYGTKLFSLPEIAPDIYLVLGGGSVKPYDESDCDNCSVNTEGNVSLCPISARNLFGWERDCDFHYYDSKRRARGTFWSQSHAYFSSIGMKTRNQRRRYGVWWNINKNQISLKGKGKYTFKLSNITYTRPYEQSEEFDTKKVVRRLDFEFSGTVTCTSPLSVQNPSNEQSTEKPQPKCKLYFKKPAQVFKMKEHTSDHAVYFTNDKNIGKIFKF